MKPWLALSRSIDYFNGHLGGLLKWLILVAVIISGGNAILRKVFNIGSNAWLEAQWSLFAAVFMLGAGYAFLRNAHVRIDFLANKLSPQGRNWIDIIGIVVFLLPLTLQALMASHRIPHTVVAPLLVIGGGLALRFVIVAAGQYSHWTSP